MSVQIFYDIEEALARQIRRITFDDQRTLTRTVLQDVFDPFTGELQQVPIEPTLYDSGSDSQNIQYPNFFIKLLKTREDRFSKREVPLYGNLDTSLVLTSPKAYKIVSSGIDGVISSAGNSITTSIFNLDQILPNYLIRVLNGNNIGTYVIQSISSNSITVSNTLVNNLPSLYFDPIKNTVLFSSSQDLNTVQINDQFKDSNGKLFNINSINYQKGLFTVTGSLTPSLLAGGSIQRVGNVFKNSDISTLRYIIMNPNIPVEIETLDGIQQGTSETLAYNWPVPLDIYYLVRVDSKERSSHIEIINRIWEEFNPPRTGLPIIVRTDDSADELLTQDVPKGGSSIISVTNNSLFNPGDKVYIIDDFNPTQDQYGNFQQPFSSEIIGINSNNQLILADIVPDTFLIKNNAKIVSNAYFHVWLFHFVDHNTRDIESAQYWVHEFTFIIQAWVNRLGLPQEYGVINRVATPTGTIEEGIIIDEN